MDFEVNGLKYRSTKLDPFIQFHVARKLSPIVSGVVDALSLLSGPNATEQPIEAFQPLLEQLARLPEDDVNFVLHHCMAVTSRELAGGTGWAPVFNMAVKKLQYDDIGMIEMLQIAIAVIQESVGNFSNGLASGLTVWARPGQTSNR